MEIWKDIPGYEGLYQASTYGRIKSLAVESIASDGRRHAHASKILAKRYRGRKNKRYYSVLLYKDRQTKIFSSHRLVAITFLPNPENKLEINHINNDPFDNRVTNLQWATAKENSQHKKLFGNENFKEKKVIVKTAEGKTLFSFTGIRALAKKLNFNRGRIGMCMNGQIKTYRGLIFEAA